MPTEPVVDSSFNNLIASNLGCRICPGPLGYNRLFEASISGQ